MLTTTPKSKKASVAVSLEGNPELVPFKPVEVAQLLRVSVATVNKLIENGELGSIRVGSKIRVTRRHFEDYLGTSKPEVG